MSLSVEEAYPNGVPQTAVPGFAPSGIAWHWSAGGTGRAGWEASVRYLIDSRYSTNASYHLGFWHEHNPPGCVTRVQWIVPVDKAAHSLAPGLAFVPKTGNLVEAARMEDVRRILFRDSDPNADVIAAAYAGMPEDLATDMQCPVFVEDVRQLARDLESISSLSPDPHFGHGWIQPTTRYEMDAPGVDFIFALAPVFDEPAEPAPPPPPPPPPMSREDRLAAEVVQLRARFPAQALHWANSFGTQALDGKPLTRETRLAGEVLYMRRVATGTDAPTK